MCAQLAERLLENKHIKLADILEISNVLKANARDVGGTGDDVLSKGKSSEFQWICTNNSCVLCNYAFGLEGKLCEMCIHLT